MLRTLRIKLLSLALLPPATKRVAIAVPLPSHGKLNEDERLSLRLLERHLGRYDRFVVVPEDLPVDMPGYGVKRFPSRFFGSGAAHAALQLSPSFFRAFADYEYVLMYHTDCLVFSDQLERWCDRGWDFIGAPWMPGEHIRWIDAPRVGNSGFALFHVRHCLRVLYSPRLRVNPFTHFRQCWVGTPGLGQRVRRLPSLLLRFLPPFNGLKKHLAYYLKQKSASDLFWSDLAVHYDPRFRVADVEDGLWFAFETEPRRCLELTGGALPFGAHAWAYYDRPFWESVLAGRGGPDAAPPAPASREAGAPPPPAVTRA